MRAVEDFHGKGAATGFELFHGCHEVGQRTRLQGGGHDDNAEVGSVVFLKIEAAAQGDIHGEAAFVKFVEDDCGDSIEGGILVEDALEDSVGEVEDFGFI